MHHTQCLLGTRVEMIFAKAPFAGTVQGYEIFSDFGDRIQHLVVFNDGSAQDHAWSGVLAEWTRQAVGQQHNNNTPATYVLEVRRAVAQLL